VLDEALNKEALKRVRSREQTGLCQAKWDPGDQIVSSAAISNTAPVP